MAEPASTPIGSLIVEAFAAYEKGGFEAAIPFATPDVEIYAPPGMINAGESQGREGAGAWNRAWSEAWDEQHYEIREVEVLGPDRAVASVLVVARGRSSGLSTEMRQWWFFEVRDGKIARWHLYPDRDRALAAAEA